MIHKIRFKLEYLWYYLHLYLPFFFAGLLLGSTTFFYRDKVYKLISAISQQPQIIGIAGLYTDKNLPEDIKDLISYGLTQNDERDHPQISPIVESYTMSEDGLKYTFILAPNLHWHDGTNFTAYDIKYQFPGITFTPIENNKIVISSKTTFAPLMSLLSRHLFRDTLIGLGRYKVNKIGYQDGYIKSLSLTPTDSTSNQLVYKFYPNDDDLITAYKLGEIDQIETNIFPESLSHWNNSQITPKISTNSRYSALFFNTEKINKQTRQALAYATPKTADQNDRALSPISANSWAYNPNVKEYNYSPQRAAELFNKSDLESVTLLVNDRSLLSTAETIKESWIKNLDIKVTIVVENRIDPQKYQVVLAYGAIPHDPDQYLFWHSTQTKTNLTHLNNPRIDNLLEEGRQTLNYPDRRRIYQDFQKYLLEECPAVFLSYPTTYTVTRIK